MTDSATSFFRQAGGANGWHQDPDHHHVMRGIDLEPDGGWHPDAAHRILNGTATHDDLLSHMDTGRAGHYWYTHNADQPHQLDDAKVYADPKEPMSNWAHRSEPGEHILGSVGTVLVGHRPKGWNPDDNHDDGLMGNSTVPDHSHIPLHAIHYSADGDTWHTAHPPAGTTVHTDGEPEHYASPPDDGQEASPHTATAFFHEAAEESKTYRWTQTYQGPNGYEDREQSVQGPLYHGGGARLRDGQQIKPGRKPNAWGDEHGKSEHVFFTRQKDTAASYAQQSGGHVFEVEPTGDFRMDHNEGDFKTKHPLNVVRRLDPSEWSGEQKTSGLTAALTASAYFRQANGTDDYTECDQGHSHWGTAGAAGLLIRHTDVEGTPRFLLQKRAPWVQHGGTWSVPGGALHEGEAPEAGAHREAEEEMGDLPALQHRKTHTDDHGGWAYHTVVSDSPHRFAPKGGDGESDAHSWRTADEINDMHENGELHPGFAASWPSLAEHAKRTHTQLRLAKRTATAYFAQLATDGYTPTTQKEGEHGNDEPRRTAGDPATRGHAGRPAAGQPESASLHRREASAEGVERHPELQGDLDRLGGGARHVQDTIRALHQGGSGVTSYPLSHPLEGWHAALTSGGHQVVHRHDPDTGALHVGYAGHNISDAEQRLGAAESDSKALPVDFHGGAEKDFDKLHPEVQDKVLNTIDRLSRGEAHPHDHNLAPAMPEWRSARADFLHRVTHRYEDEDGNPTSHEKASRLFIGHVGPHNYEAAEKRLSALTATAYFKQAYQGDTPDGTLARGMNVTLPADKHSFIHDERQPLPARAHLLLSELKKPTDGIANEELKGSSGGLGEFWTRNHLVSDDAAATQHEERPPGQRSTTVTLHAHEPGGEHFWREMAGGHGEDYEGNWRVPLRPGTPLGVHAITWGEPGGTQHHYDFSHSVDKHAIQAVSGMRQTAGVDHIDLYHRTTPENAAAIYREKRMHSKENLGGRKPLFFSTFRGDEDGAVTGGYGEGLVHVRVPHHLAEIDDEFPSGEEHYSIDQKDLRPEHFVDEGQHKEAAAVDNSGGVMVALVPPREIAEQLVMKDGQPVDDLHVTLAYLGKASDYTPEQLKLLPQIVSSWALRQKPVSLRIGGTGKFNSSHKGQHVLYAAVDIPGGAQMHADLARYLQGHGYELPSEHGWTPHLTLSYVDRHFRFMPHLDEHRWTAEHVVTEVGTTRHQARLGTIPSGRHQL